MTIIKTRNNVGNAGLQYAEIEVTADRDTCRMAVSTPTLEGAELQAYCDARESEYKLAVLKAMYPDAYNETFEDWILDGHTNPAVEDYPEGVIEKVPWVDMRLEVERVVEEEISRMES